jgi:DNA-binding phage protein
MACWRHEPARYLTTDDAAVVSGRPAVLETGDRSAVARAGDVARARGMGPRLADRRSGRESLYKALALGAKPRLIL